ncbi:MAG: UDP-N-acetylmuramate dehydrogenase [Acidobacteria bacterium]|nr:UDP-N-acetylmuramate dehydrogenase [Acidobacteriota bacterium]
MRIEENRELAPLTTFGVGGPARWFVKAAEEADVIEAVEWAHRQRASLFILGGGSNLLVSDDGFDGLVLQIALKGIRGRLTPDSANCLYEVGAGEDWDAFVQRTVEENCAGIECLAGIPGTVGGTPVQNVGAYGEEVSSTIQSVRAYDTDRKQIVELGAGECGFSYRSSRFNSSDRGRFVVLSVVYRLARGGSPTLKYADLQRVFTPGYVPSLNEVAGAVRQIRQSKGMLLVEGDPDCRSAGSFFKNPIISREIAAAISQTAGSEPPRFSAGADLPEKVKLPAAWLIEQAGFARGYRLGRAGISSKHTLALVNLGGARASEIVALANEIRSAVSSKFSVELEMEPVMLGF